MENAAVAREFLLSFAKGIYESPRLAENLVHRGPLGNYNSRREYIAGVIPKSGKSINHIDIKQFIEQGDTVCIRYDSNTPVGTIPMCDWIKVKDGMITEIHSFYDATEMRRIIEY